MIKMDLQFFKTIFARNDLTFKNKLSLLLEYYTYYRRLKKSLAEETLFHNVQKQNEYFKNFIQKLDETDYNLINRLFNDEVKIFLKKQKLKSSIDFKKNEDFIQMGENFVLVEEPMKGLWTTGKGAIFMPVKLQVDNTFRIDFFSIAPINVEINLEGSILKKFSMNRLSSKTVEFITPKKDIKEEIVKLFIKTDQLWLPNSIINREEIVPVGVGLKLVTNLSF